MTIIFYDGSFMTAKSIEISRDREYLILDGDIYVEIDEVVRIV